MAHITTDGSHYGLDIIRQWGSYVNIMVNAIKSNKQLIMRHYCVNITIDLIFELYTPVFTVGMN